MEVQIQTFLMLQAEAQTNLTTFCLELSEIEREAIGTLERWSAKDLLAHISNWWNIQGGRFAQIAQGNISVDFSWSNEENAEAFATNTQKSWEEVLAEMAQSAACWQLAIQSLKAEDLLLQDPREEGTSNPLWRLILGNGYLHPHFHLAEHYLEHGKLVEATAIQEEMATRLVNSLPNIAGLAHYNLACFYAQTGREEQAITELQIAFMLDTTLTTSAQQDQDFASIQTHAPFQALFNERKEN